MKPDVFSRIVRIADVFDALTSARSYKMIPFSRDEALEIITEKSGIELDPVLSEIIRDVVGAIPEPPGPIEIAALGSGGSVAIAPRR